MTYGKNRIAEMLLAFPQYPIRRTLYEIRFRATSHEPRVTGEVLGPSTTVENPLQIGPFMQNKAKVKIGKMNVSVATTKHYDKNIEKSTMNVIQNKAKQSQS